MPSKIHWDEELTQVLLDGVSNKWTLRRLELRLGISDTAIKRKLKELNIQRTDRNRNHHFQNAWGEKMVCRVDWNVRDSELFELLKICLGIRPVARKMKLHHSTVRRRLKFLRISPRPWSLP